MGLGIHELNAISYVKNRFGPLGKVATFGRQGLSGTYKSSSGKIYTGYCEPLLIEEFGATEVHSYDFSDYEGATHIYDLGCALPVSSEYNLVIDGGTSEHIFNISQSLLNASKLTTTPGIVVHFLPANSFCGHGMYQVSPELFFSLYSKDNGFDTEVFVARYYGLNCYKSWYRVEKPRRGKRVEFSSKSSVGLIVIARKSNDSPLEHIYQSDYRQTWMIGSINNNGEDSNLAAKIKALLVSVGLFKPAKNTVNWLRSLRDLVDFKSHENIRRESVEGLLRVYKKQGDSEALHSR